MNPQIMNASEKEPWRTRPDFTIIISRLPSALTLAELYDSFARHGNISWLQIDENRNGDRNRFAKVRFEPPPKLDFWSSKAYTVRYGESKSVQVSLREFKTPHETYEGLVKSPSNPDIWLKSRISLQADRMDFGSRLQENEMVVLKSVTSGVRIDVNLSKKNLSIYFDTYTREQEPTQVAGNQGGQNLEDDDASHHKCSVDFARLTGILRATEGNETTLVIPLELPPMFWTKANRRKRSQIAAGTSSWGSLDMWERRTAILDDEQLPRDFPVTLQADFDDPNFINIGRWTTFRFVIQNTGNPVDEVLEMLQAYNVATTVLSHFRSVPPRLPLLGTLLPTPTLTSDKSSTNYSLLSRGATSDHLNFEVYYQLEVCISRGVLSEYSITQAFIDELSRMDKDRAKWMLEYFADLAKRVWDPMKMFEDEDARFFFPNASMPYYCTTIRKITVTPSTMHFCSPNVESSNRVLRKYNSYQDRFLRVQFTDELYKGKVYNNAGTEIFNRIYRVLKQGIKIGNRVYEFLAFGNSQIRECAVYFFCPTAYTTCDDIRQWMGEFSHIRNVAKYAARIGQCFSTTREIRGVTVPRIVQAEDIERGGYCFSDGVGKISKLLAEMVVNEMGQESVGIPSAFQFRMGGCKGMLAVWPDAKGLEVHIRPSQEKFKAQFNGLEIIRFAQYSVATLNRQTITILATLGVESEPILQLAKQQVQNYEKAMRDRVAAAGLLGRYVDENMTSLTIKDLVCWGFMDTEVQEPFVLTILNLWRIWSVKLLKEKARVIVEQSAFLLGCLDETGTLRGHSKATEGRETRNIEDIPQIFLQIPNPDDGKFYCVTGVCIVGRNPSLHPGDIRVVEAVDVPALRHLKNVVVFPSIGDRDVPSMLSGGDLDGDDFFVIWNPALIPPQWHQPPMDYVASKAPVLKRGFVKVSDLRTFFVRYMQNDCLALVAVAHLAQADQSQAGARDGKCIKLAELHSKAVDYVKTADPADFPPYLQPKRWPHFMNRKNTYKSLSPIGQIYDMIQDQALDPLYEKKFDNRILNRFTLTDDLLQKARKVKRQYDTSMRRLMSYRDVKTEFEAWTGFVLSRPRVGSDYKQQEDIGRESAALKQRFREICYNEAGSRNYDDFAPFVAAMYKVTEEQVNAALAKEYEDEEHKRQSMPLISFPWIFHWIMGRIATGHVKINPTIDPEAQPMTKKAYPFRRVEGDMVQQETQLDGGRVVHRGDLLEVFESPTKEDDGEVSQAATEDATATGGEEIHVEEESAMDAMDRLMSGAMG
ncbi:RNA dependent RNA polymerase [Colletotrichum graminicola M1.001]|uniref:RNA-dependent RNA polymerase n=1 Tax=Colletotrichum graminicola (strain M1.001 / M2 / FGSC 10212) TaxID=645133 RepID=E3Q757_COLGM|nr:RNA dependent RNA polymerase [Colletotrichum graminicola M1.001]EFQ26695.1 RNA dependent RNA polymerase [Colletotrichum graminicola M1.001]